jgi:hypothetical protein
VNGVVPSAAGPVQRAHSDGHGARCAFAQKASPIRLTDPLGGLSWILARCTDTDGWMSEVNVTISVPEPVHLLRQPTPTQIGWVTQHAHFPCPRRRQFEPTTPRFDLDPCR